MTTLDTHIATFMAQTAHMPTRTWCGQCVDHLHDSTESWEVQAKSEYEAAIMLRAQLRQQGRVMPADLVWTAQ